MLLIFYTSVNVIKCTLEVLKCFTTLVCFNYKYCQCSFQILTLTTEVK